MFDLMASCCWQVNGRHLTQANLLFTVRVLLTILLMVDSSGPQTVAINAIKNTPIILQMRYGLPQKGRGDRLPTGKG